MKTKKATKQSRRTAARKARQEKAWFQYIARYKLERSSFRLLTQASKQRVVEFANARPYHHP